MVLNEGIRSEEISACFLCGVEGSPIYKEMRDRLFDAPGVWNIFHCSQCRLMWLNPRPTQEDNYKIYAKYLTHAIEDLKPVPFSVRKKLKYYILASCFGYNELFDGPVSRWMGKMASAFPFRKEIAGRSVSWIDGAKKGRLLDIGCGNGKFLAEMRRLGWNVIGVEPDAEAVNIAREHFGLKAMAGTLEEARFPDDCFDAVTVRHVIEHVHNPAGLLMECGRVLKPEGKLVVTTPNTESLGHRYFRQSWFPLDPPRHLHLFSVPTLKSCAQDAGLRTKAVRTAVYAPRLMWAASRLIQRNGTLPGGLLPRLSWSLRLERKGFQLSEYLLHTFWKSAGEEVVMTATKGH